jgi:YggT family protein
MAMLLLALQGLMWWVIADAVLSWFQPRDAMPRKLTSAVTEPLYAPIRKVLDPSRTGGLDLSPMVVILAIQALQHFVVRL